MKVLQLKGIVEARGPVNVVQLELEHPADYSFEVINTHAASGTHVVVAKTLLDKIGKNSLGLQLRRGNDIGYVTATPCLWNPLLANLNLSRGFVPDPTLHLPECPGRIPVESRVIYDADGRSNSDYTVDKT